MCTPWTVARLMRWRIGEWTSCAFASSKLPSDEEPDTIHPSVPHSSSETRSSEAKQDKTRMHVIKPGKTRSKHKSNKHRLVPVSIPIENSERPNNKSTCSDYQPFKEEDYIVFCVNKDGTFDVVEDEKSESAYHVKYRTEPLRAVNRKLVYKEDTVTDSKYGDEDVSNEDGVDFDATNVDSDILTDVEGEYEDSIYFDSEAPHPRIRAEAYCKKGNDDDESGINSQESSFSTSTLSRSSTGSFAFPVLRCEWNGSPVKMPEPEGLHLRKHKSLCISLQCCKF